MDIDVELMISEISICKGGIVVITMRLNLYIMKEVCYIIDIQMVRGDIPSLVMK